MAIDENVSEIARFIGKLLRENFGKGPESVYVHIEDEIVTVYLRNFISPTEKVLINQKQEQIFQQTRDTIIEALLPEIKAFIHIVTGIEFSSFYYDWGIHNGSGILVGLGVSLYELREKSLEDYAGKLGVHEQIAGISQEVQKVPDEIFSYFLNPRTLLIFRQGILVGIEKELIRQGLEEPLKTAKRAVEKRYFHNSYTFETLLRTQIQDVFVDWNFSKDNSIIVFIVNPPSS